MEKKRRTTALSKFTRNLNSLNEMLDNASPKVIVTPQFEKLVTCWNNLEDVHDNFLEVTDVDIETDDRDGLKYLDEPSQRYRTVVKRYSDFLKTSEEVERADLLQKGTSNRDAEEVIRKQIVAEKREAEDELQKQLLETRFESAKAEIETSIDAFNRLATSLKESVVSGSDSDKRRELEKVETDFKLLKNQLVKFAGIDHNQDISDINMKFVDDAEKMYIDFHKLMIKDLKDSSTSGGSSRHTDYSTKKELVRLPSFQGDEKTSPFLKFPIWKKQWNSMILEYEEKYRAGLLWEHVDDAARGKFIGYETNYAEASKRLNQYFGDPLKVIKCVMQEVMAPSSISEGDYKGLIGYSVILENNFNRLTSMNLQHEMSNTSAMSTIVKKFPRLVGEKWHEHLLGRSSDEKARPFPIFIDWLTTQKEMWECMVSSDVGKSRKFSYFVEEFPAVVEKKCFGCGEMGHIRRLCPNKGNDRGNDNPLRPRKSPKVKKYWCALHKGDKTKKCYSNSCLDLRRMSDVQKRINLLKENGDCIHCCGDHKSAECRQKERVCGGGKADRGCTKTHQLHELFCTEAKACMLAQEVKLMAVDNDVEGVVLCIMKVHAPKRYIASVFWDSGCTSNFVRESFAKHCGFKGHSKTLSVTTLGGVVTDYLTVTLYNCSLKDESGEMVPFQAYGLESITGSVSQICSAKLRKWFPHISDKMIKYLERGNKVDFLIGLLHPSWHPERAERAKGGGDFWIYRGRFGACVGGRHPEIAEGTRRSDSLFTVNHTFFSEVLPSSFSSHELEFCSARAMGRYDSSVKQLSVGKEDEQLCVDLFPACLKNSDCGEIVDLPVADASNVNSNVDFIGGVSDVNSGVDSAVGGAVESVCSNTVVAVSNADSILERGERADSPVVGVTDVSSNLDLIKEVACVDPKSGSVPVLFSDASVTICTNENFFGEKSFLNVTAPVYTPGEYWKPASSDDCPILPADVSCGAALTCPLNEDLFFQAESLGTVVEPQCGGCKCSKCPVPGSKYSFKEQKEFDTILKNLSYQEDLKRWFTSYPWKCERSVLPKNDKAALKLLLSLEKSLQKDSELAKEYCQQIQNMVDRGAAVILSEEVLDKWEGDYYYLPMVGVKGKKSLRVCFDASRKQYGHPSMNDCLYKGPDRFVNNLLSVILGFRNGRVGCAADITKFHNQVHLFDEDVHMQRFLWRNMETKDAPQTYAVAVNNFGVKPANCIATCALRNSADQFATIYPIESEEIKLQTYIDDGLTAAPSKDEALIKTQRWDEIGAHASMPNKGWTFSGDDKSDIAIGGETDIEKVLGLSWDPKSDSFIFQAKLRVKLRQGGIEEVEISSVEELEQFRDAMLNRRMLLSNVQSIFDPAGLLAPILLQSKLLMRESWSGPKPVGWDDLLPEDQGDRWVAFLSALLSLGELRFPRSLWPEGEVVGLPVLIIFSDGAALAFGAAAYIRWELKAGGFWTRLVMAKCKIAPKNILSVPRMELNGAVLGNRVKIFILKDTNLQFSRVYQLVDSSTVLGYVHKECGVFKPYEGIRVSEIQSTNSYAQERLLGWAWVAGVDNPADWCTKPRPVKDLFPGGFWQTGPQFLLLDESEWPVKLTYRTDRLEGELVVGKQCHVSVVNVAHPDLIGRTVNRCGSWKKMYRVLGWILRLGFPSGPLTAEEIRRAKQLLIKYAQKEMVPELKLSELGKGRYRRLAPMLDEDGLWRVGSRVRHHVPFTIDSKLPVLLPTNHTITLQVMRSAHRHSHVAQDGTLCRFRMQGYWAVKAGVLAKKVASACVPCRKNSTKTISQPLGEFPAEQLMEPTAWGHCQMDLFGPFHCRGDVNPRTTKKTWGMVVEDVNSGAVHLDVVSDYSTNAVLLTLRRFGSLRGWPGEIRSDPGSQLESASGKLENWWSNFGDSLRTLGGSKNFEWKLSPADSPWRQGKAERRIGVVKKLIRVSVGDTRLSPLELQTVLMEISNICNERPIGLSKPRQDGTYTVITPNHLLLGRSSNVLPDDAGLCTDLPVAARYRLVNHTTTVFWKKWCCEVAPRLIFRQKWHEKTRDLRIGDLVMICAPSQIKAKYKLAIVECVHSSSDGCVRSATVYYMNIQNGGRCMYIRVKRSVQRLVLILPVEEQVTPLEVKDNDSHVEVECRSTVKAGV